MKCTINSFAEPNIINPTNRLCEFKMSAEKMKVEPRVKRALVPREYIKATDIMVGVFHGSHYRITSAWPNVITSHPRDDLRATEPPTRPLARFWTGRTIILQQHWSIVKFTVGLINATISK